MTSADDATPPRRRPYHHGNLAEALVGAGMALAERGGPSAVTVREAARTVGVTPPAAYRHFADRDHLLAEVARRCRERLAEAMIAARETADGPYRRFSAVGRAYVEFALAEPGLIECAFAGGDSTQPDDPDAFAVLVDALEDLHRAGLLPSERREGAEIVAWAAVHGIALLLARSPASKRAGANVWGLVERVLQGVDDALGISPASPGAADSGAAGATDA